MTARENSLLTPLALLLAGVIHPCSAFSSEIQLPDGFTCEQCIIQLLRQAQEWVGGYTFWSCADVSIVSSSDCEPIAYYHLCLTLSHTPHSYHLSEWGHRGL